MNTKNIDILFAESGAESFSDFWLAVNVLVTYAESLARVGVFSQGEAKYVLLYDLQKVLIGEPEKPLSFRELK